MTGRLPRLRRALLIAVLACAGALVTAAAVPSAVASTPGTASRGVVTSSQNLDDFVFESLHVDYALSRAEDGTSRATVTETFVAVFPEYDQNRGMRRAVPDSYQGAPLHPRLVSITDADGRSREAETDSQDGYYFMTSRAGDFVHGRQTYVFTYTLENVTRFFSDTGVDEFYWDVNGTGWPQWFGEVTTTVHLTPDLAAALTGDAACYVGYYGSGGTCPIEVDAAAGEVSAGSTDVQPYQTVTVAIAFAPGTFVAFDSSYLASGWGWAQGLAGVLVVGALVTAFVMRFRYLRDAPGRPTIIAEYTPPPGIDALESAVLLGRPQKAIPAEVLEQAVVGSIRIMEGERRWFGKPKLIAELIDPSLADGDGAMLLDGLFPFAAPGEQYEFGRQDTRLSTRAQKILKAAATDLTTRGLRRKVPARARAVPWALAFVATGATVVFGILALDGGVDALVPVLMIVGSGLVTLLVGVVVGRKPLTAAGAETRDHLKGLEEFIDWAEADRIRMLQSPQGAERVRIDVNDPRQMLDLYEKLLPFAVVFGQEKKWAAQLAVMYGPNHTPGWYYGTHGFDARAFSSSIATLSASSASSSSSSGGSSGGGSAGGGGGGGGGGGV